MPTHRRSRIEHLIVDRLEQAQASLKAVDRRRLRRDAVQPQAEAHCMDAELDELGIGQPLVEEARPLLIGIFGGNRGGNLAVAEVEHHAIGPKAPAAGAFSAGERGPVIHQVLDVRDGLGGRRHADGSHQAD